MPHPALALLPAAAAALLNATVWGLAWLPLKWLQAHGIDAAWVTLCIFSACTAAVLLARPAALRRLLAMPQLLWLMVASGTTNVCFNLSMADGDVVRSILLFYLMPIWVVVLARWLLREAITAAALARVALALLGALLVLGEGRLVVPLPASAADALALFAGIAFALNNVLLRRFAALPDEVRTLAMFGGAVLLSPLAILALLVLGQPPRFAPQGLAWLVLPAFALAVLIGNLALQYAATRLRANVLSVLMLAEIVVASLSSWWAGSAAMPASTLLGGLLIVGASVLSVAARTAKRTAAG